METGVEAVQTASLEQGAVEAVRVELEGDEAIATEEDDEEWPSPLFGSIGSVATA